jgi:hypothetical protein
MKKGTHAPAPTQQPIKGPQKMVKPKGMDVKFGYAPAGRTGKAAKKTK